MFPSRASMSASCTPSTKLSTRISFVSTQIFNREPRHLIIDISVTCMYMCTLLNSWVAKFITTWHCRKKSNWTKDEVRMTEQESIWTRRLCRRPDNHRTSPSLLLFCKYVIFSKVCNLVWVIRHFVMYCMFKYTCAVPTYSLLTLKKSYRTRRSRQESDLHNFSKCDKCQHISHVLN